MKKVFGYIFKDWKWFDYAILGLYVLYIVLFKIYAPFPILPAIFGLFVVLAAIYFPKNTLLGYFLTVGALGGLAYYEFKCLLYGSFAATLIVACLAIYSALQLIFKKENEKDDFDKWDYMILGLGLAIAAFPSYLLMVQVEANVAIAQGIQLIIALALVFLKLKNYSFRKYFYMANFALEFVGFLMLLISLNVDIASLVGTLLFVVFICIKELIVSFIKKKPAKQVGEQQEEKLETKK